VSTEDWNCSQKRGHDSMSPEKGSNLMVGSLTVGAVGVKEGSEVEVRVMRDTEADSWLSMARVAL